MEEHTLIAKRIKAARYMIKDLLDAMMQDPLSEEPKIHNLREELAAHYHDNTFLKARTMGALVKHSLKIVLIRNKQHFERKLNYLKY
jgi:hypothetical protein